MATSGVATGRVETSQPLVGAVRSCTAVSESFGRFNRLAAALAKSQDRRASARGFCFLAYPMRNVGGWVRDSLLHERTKAGSVGEFLERGG